MSYKRIISKIRKYESVYSEYTHGEILEKVSELKKSTNLNKILPQAFALCVVASTRVLKMTHFDVQLIGGIILHEGKIAEMKTGEGKTLVATCPVFLNALTGKGVHVITVNDYLAKRDSEQMGKVYSYLGLTTGCIYSNMPFEERKKAYECDITYGTNSEFGFDYLRDNMQKTKQMLVQRELNYAIIDEVDSILIDDSKTPLIISGGAKDSSDLFENIDKAVKSLKRTTNYNPDATKLEQMMEEYTPDGDYIVINKTKEVILTDSGIKKIEKIFGTSLSDETNLLSHYITQSLKANYIMAKDIDYIVKDDKIVIIDDSTGRLMESRKFSDNLHQAIEAKEGVKISEENKTLATVTYQNFFRMYHKISGMTGTAYTDKYEFKTIYNLYVVQVPTNKPVIRIDKEDLLFSTKIEKYNNILIKIKECYRNGQPILIGTPSVEESEIMHDFLLKCGIKHNVLNAKNHEKEAEIIAQAGRYNAVTIATNMAGRGTDILLGGNIDFLLKTIDNNEELSEEERNKKRQIMINSLKEEREAVINAGGLAVIGVERFDNRRIDDQLRGRAGRQGDPGFSQFFLSTEDKMFKNFGNSIKNSNLDFSHTSTINNKFIRNTQKMMENLNYSARKNTLDYDDVNDSQRKQIYNIRKEIMFISDDEIMKLYEKYKDEIIKLMIKDDIDLNIFFRTETNIEKTYNGINDYINSINEENIKNLTTYDNTITNMMRFIMIDTIDRNWIKYINLIISLKETVNITVMGSLKPIQLYKMESIKLFNELILDVKKDIIRSISLTKIEPKHVIEIKLD